LNLLLFKKLVELFLTTSEEELAEVHLSILTVVKLLEEDAA